MDRPDRTRWPLGLLGMLALVAAVEWSLASRPLRFAETASLNWRLSADDIPREAEKVELACLGDSLMKIGAVPEVIRAGTGKRAFNFAMARAPAPATYFMLRRLLEAGGKPSALLVEFKPSILTGGPRLSLRQFQETLTLRESWELVRDDGNLKLLPQILLGRWMPSIRYRLEVREAIRSALDGKTAPTLRTNRIALRNWTINLGGHLNSTKSTFSGEISEQIHQWFRSDDWRCHRVNELYVNRLLALAKSRSIPVLWVIPPLPPPLQERRERSGADAKFVAFVRSMQARHPEVTVVDGRRSGYESAVFFDHTHLNGRGSVAMSRELAAILARPGRRPGWIELPRFRDWPLDVPGEYVDQTTIALDEAETIRR
jgi:hypothetical protein